jgi:hypothetical protein
MARVLGTSNEAELSKVAWPVELVKLVIDPSDTNKIILLTNHFHNITVGTETYVASGEFLGVSAISDNIDAKDSVVTVSLSGVLATATQVVLANPVAGSVLEVYRGFYDEKVGNLVQNPYLQWSGHVNNFNITDDYNLSDQDTVTISVDCKSLLTTFLGRQSGLFTSLPGYQKHYSTDVSMEFVAGLSDRNWQFGKED